MSRASTGGTYLCGAVRTGQFITGKSCFFILLYLTLISKEHVEGGGVNLTTLLCLMQLIVPELEKNGAGCFQFLSHSKWKAAAENYNKLMKASITSTTSGRQVGTDLLKKISCLFKLCCLFCFFFSFPLSLIDPIRFPPPGSWRHHKQWLAGVIIDINHHLPQHIRTMCIIKPLAKVRNYEIITIFSI